MSNARTILMLLTATGLLLFFNFLVRYGGHGSATVKYRNTLLEPTRNLTRITIERNGSLPTVLEKQDEWCIVEPYAGRVDKSAVGRFVDALSASPVIDVLSSSELLKLGRTLEDFSLAKPVLTVKVEGAVSTCVSFGSPTPAADGFYAAVDGIEAVFVVSTECFSAVDVSANDFRRRTVVDIAAESVMTLGVKRGMEQARTFQRDGDGWRLDGERISRRNIEAFLAAVTSAEAMEFVWPIGVTNEQGAVSVAQMAGYGFDPENAVTVSLKGAGDGDERISFGKVSGDGLVYALVQNGRAVVTLPAALKEAVLQGSVAFVDARLFPLDQKTVSAFSIADGDMSCSVARNQELGWRLETPISAPADVQRVDALLERVLALSSADLRESSNFVVSVAAESRSSFGVSRERVLGDLSLADLRSCEMTRVDPLVIKRIVRTSAISGKPSSEAVVYDKERGAWKPESSEAGETVLADGVARLLSALSPLTASRVERLKISPADVDAYGLGKPSLAIAVDIDRENLVRRNVLVGNRTTGGRFATVGSSDAVFVISDEVVKALSSQLIAQ